MVLLSFSPGKLSLEPTINLNGSCTKPEWEVRLTPNEVVRKQEYIMSGHRHVRRPHQVQAGYMNISLTPELEEFVREKVETGRYLSASEVVREALRVLEERDQVRQLQLKQLRDDIGEGLADLDAGRTHPLSAAQIKAEGRKLLAERNGRKI